MGFSEATVGVAIGGGFSEAGGGGVVGGGSELGGKPRCS